MSYCMSKSNSQFSIKVENKAGALAAMRALGKQNLRHHWLSGREFAKAESLKEVFEVWGWSGEFDDDGNIVDISFDSEKLGDEIVLWQTIAPFVEAGSFIEMSGEDGNLWRWMFDGTTCKEVYPTVTW
jgi:hypothetical protein